MSEFTKGPWVGDSKGYITSEEGHTVAAVFDNPDNGIHDARGFEPSDYNQALICAAPGLYEALRDVVTKWEISRDIQERLAGLPKGTDREPEHITKAKQALTKANPQAK